MITHSVRLATFLTCAWCCATIVTAQEKSVRPGINDSFRDPDIEEFLGRFEVESREVFTHRNEIVAACQIRPGQTVADIGAGTGLFTRLFSAAVGIDGRVIAVDIAQKFLDHIQATSREAGLKNIDTLLCTADSTELPPESVDVAFICDTYHHFEFPLKTMASLQRAMKPGGRVILIDFRREEGKSTEWVLSHVRAGQGVFEAEIVKAGFTKLHEERELLKENYFVMFQKPVAEGARPRQGRGRGLGRGMGRGPGPEMRADQEVFHYLLDHHAEIRRSVTKLENGVETLTESDNPKVAAKIQEHVASMHQRIKDGRGLRFWDDLFFAIFQKHASIEMSVENTERGVKVRETSENRVAVTLIQAHAEVVSLFVKHGFDEAHKNHPVPAAADSPRPLPDGPLGKTIRLGQELVEKTTSHPLAKPYVGNALNCTSCHLKNGTDPKAASFMDVAAAYPAWSPREQRVITLEDRVLNCFMRSCNGVRPPLGSEVSVAIVAYITWLSTDRPIRMNPERPAGPHAVPQLKVDINQADRQRGAKLYSARCATCHAENGQGGKEHPPVWGAQSYNDGAGLANDAQLASWLKVAMPLDEADLTDQEALDIAAFVNSHKRPTFRLQDHLPPREKLGTFNAESSGAEQDSIR